MCGFLGGLNIENFVEELCDFRNLTLKAVFLVR